MSFDHSSLQALQALGLGFAFAGLLANGFEWLTARRASFHLLETGGLAALASLPVVVFSAPFIIVRNTVRGRRFERRPIGFIMLATVIACFWSVASGRFVMDLALMLVGA